ncbi:MAG: ketopantoate reductase family protein [Streptosporangiaceae bacterium]
MTEPTSPASSPSRQAAQPTRPGGGKILVVGAGATGGFFGALLAKHGRDVTFLVRPPRAAALRQHGLRVTGPGLDEVIGTKVVTAGDLVGPFEMVLLCVKATGLATALDDLSPAVGPDTVIVPFLNGLDHMRVLNGRFGPQRVLGGVVVVATTLGAEGTIIQLAPGASITIGEQDGPPTARTEEIAGLLSGAGFTVDVWADIISAMWRKWVFIASAGALTCLARGTVGEIVAAPGGSGLGPAILAEAASVAAAAGHPLSPAERDDITGLLTQSGSAMTSSLYRDLQAGRGTEVEQIFGDLISRARNLGVATPLLDLATLALRVHERRVHEQRVH